MLNYVFNPKRVSEKFDDFYPKIILQSILLWQNSINKFSFKCKRFEVRYVNLRIYINDFVVTQNSNTMPILRLARRKIQFLQGKNRAEG